MNKPRYSFPVPIKPGMRKSCERIPGYYGRDIFIVGASPGEFKWMVHAINTHVALQEKVEAAIRDCEERHFEAGSRTRQLAFEEVLGWLKGEV